MRAWRFAEFGDIRNLRLGDYPMPERDAGDIIVRIAYAALNPADRLLVEGKYPGAGALPLTVGRDGSGVVHDAGQDTQYAKGDPVLILRSPIGITRQGTLAEYVSVPSESVVRLPEGWTFEEGAAASVVYLTAWKALVTQGGLKSGETLIVNGASGGVGLATLEVAKALGARTVALSRAADKRAALLQAGADIVVDSSAGNPEARVREALDGAGADVMVENLGGKSLNTSVSLMNPDGRILVVGLLAGAAAELNLGPLLFKQVRIEGVHVGKFSPAQAQEAWSRVVDALRNRGTRPRIDSVFEMENAQAAFERLQGSHFGKVLVGVGDRDV